jgi:hypothetical protein
MSDIVAWECGLCKTTNEDMARRHYLICGEQRPVCYFIVGGPIEESEIGKLFHIVRMDKNKRKRGGTRKLKP